MIFFLENTRFQKRTDVQVNKQEATKGVIRLKMAEKYSRVSICLDIQI